MAALDTAPAPVLVPSPAPEPKPSIRYRLLVLLGRHWLLTVLLVAGTVLRVLTWLAYQPALLYTDSYYYLDNVQPLDPQYLDPIGYPLLVLKPLLAIHGLQLVSAVQQAVGLLMAYLLYRVALRCHVPRWLAALATAPVLLDAYQLQIEQNILSDVWLELLLVLLLWLLLGRGVPGARWAALAGLTLGVAMTIRMVSITMIVPVALFLLVIGREWRVPGGWRRIAGRLGALGACFGIIVLAYATYFHAKAGYWGLNTASGNSLYGRTAEVADCPKLDLDPVLAQLCPQEPLGQRLSTDNYAHLDVDPNWPGNVPAGETKYDLDRQFAMRVIEKQPWDVLHAILVDFGKGWVWTKVTLPGDPALESWQFQTTYPVFPMEPLESASDSLAQTQEEVSFFGGTPISTNTGLATFLRAYQLDGGYTPGPILAACGILGLLAGLFRARGGAGRAGPAALFAAGAALTVLGTAAVFEFSWRYQLPGLVLLPLAGALALTAMAPLGPALWRKVSGNGLGNVLGNVLGNKGSGNGGSGGLVSRDPAAAADLPD
jgi:hypothetical protein